MTSYFQNGGYDVISRKSLRVCHFKLGGDEIWHECFSLKYISTDRVRFFIWFQ